MTDIINEVKLELVLPSKEALAFYENIKLKLKENKDFKSQFSESEKGLIDELVNVNLLSLENGIYKTIV